MLEQTKDKLAFLNITMLNYPQTALLQSRGSFSVLKLKHVVSVPESTAGWCEECCSCYAFLVSLVGLAGHLTVKCEE